MKCFNELIRPIKCSITDIYVTLTPGKSLIIILSLQLFHSGFKFRLQISNDSMNIYSIRTYKFLHANRVKMNGCLDDVTSDKFDEVTL